MSFDSQQAFALMMAELKEMRQDITEIKNNMATKEQVATKDQLANVMEAINTTNRNLSAKLDKLAEKDKELETVASRNSYDIALLLGKAQ
ncbi:MAG: hypothetical protein IKU46_04750 [Peptococcaceae bacterium]|nr:hypothetical protein [Peptococcaceae bacterium]